MKEARPARAKFVEASPTLYSASSTVVTDPPMARAALASHRVEYPLDVPISSTRRARVAMTSTARKEPVSRVILSIRRGRSAVELSLALPKCSSSAIKLSSGRGSSRNLSVRPVVADKPPPASAPCPRVPRKQTPGSGRGRPPRHYRADGLSRPFRLRARAGDGGSPPREQLARSPCPDAHGRS